MEEIGPFDVEVTKSRISFTTRARFAGVDRLSRDALILRFWLKRRVEHPRFSEVEHLGRHDWLYQLPLRSGAELDDEFRGWMEEAYRVGQQLG